MEAEKAFNKVQHVFMIELSANQKQKECSQLDEEHYLKNVIPNIFLNSVKLTAFGQFSIIREDLASAQAQDK